ncbi:polysaccharide pyruvyl transferase CsaB [Desulfolucanica intricata]|uniref:polysaccharide pyruvyl transferase CsaB n=1 Tax=Desulfolucanica intricata TaxID=1285191 RepID=UPI0008311087|nr:polysaccharide pyruvyl transferase CsaB [Desulfolucanica intricata]
MPKVVISGYYGFHNEGDEAMLYAIVNALRNRIPQLEIVVLSMDPAYTARQFQVNSIHRDNPAHIWQALKKTDLLISGGGGLLQDVTGPNSILYYLGIVMLAKLMGKPVCFYGQGIGPVRTALGRAMMKLIANRVDFITVRDAASRVELENLGVRRPPVHVTADPVLGLDSARVDKARGKAVLKELGLDDRPVMGISVRPWKKLTAYRRVIADLAGDYTRQGFQVLIVPMHHSADLEVSREIAKLVGKDCAVLDKNYNFLDLLEIIANLDVLIGMRLHFLIFGALLNVPIVGIAYDPKVSSFLELVDMPLGGYVESLEYEQLSAVIKEVLDAPEQVREKLKARVKALRKEALRGADLVEAMLKKY